MKRLYLKIILISAFFTALVLAGNILFRLVWQNRWLDEDLQRQGQHIFSPLMDRQFDFWRERFESGQRSAQFFVRILSRDNPEERVAFDMSGGNRRLQLGNGDASLGISLARSDTPEPEARKLAGQYEQLASFSQSIRSSVSDIFFISPDNWLAMLPARWEMEAGEGRDFTTDPAYTIAIPESDPQRQARMADFYFDNSRRQWMATMSTPVYVGDRFSGVAGQRIAIDQLFSSRTLHPAPGAQLFIADADLRVILHSGLIDTYRGQRFHFTRPFDSGSERLDPATRSTVAAARQQPFSSRFFPVAGDRYLALCRREPHTGWHYFLVIRTSAVASLARRVADTGLMINIVGLLLVLVLMLLFLRASILRPLQTMSDSLERYGTTGSGEFHFRQRSFFNEISTLFHRINDVLRQIHDKASEAQQAREKVETLMRTAQVIVVTLDSGLNLSYINDYGLRKLGVRANEISGPRIREFMMSGFLNEAAAVLQQHNEVLDRETQLTMPSGEKLDVDISVAKTLGSDGQLSGYIAVIADITQRKRAETDLRNQIVFSQQIFTSIPEMILIVDTQLRVTFLNKQARDQIHAAAEEGPIGRPLAHQLSKRSIESGFDETVRNVIEHGQGISQINRLNPFVEDESFVDLLVEPLQSGGRRIGAILLLRDISEWRNLTSQLRALQGFMQKLINASPFAVISINNDHIVTTWNQSAEKMLGVSFEIAFGKSLFQLMPPFGAYQDSIREAMILKKTSFHSDEKLMIGDDRFIVANLTFYPVTAEQNGVAIHIEDLSELKKLESSLLQAQKMESLGVLASGMIHDFNNVLSGILGYASLLEKKIGDDPKLGKYVSTIISSSERASNLISQILNYSRKKLSQKEIVNINELIQESLDFISFNLKTVKVETELTKEKALLSADKTKISQTLINLILNAKDALDKTPQPLIRIRTEIVAIQGHAHLLDGPYVLTVVSDNGTGIPKENLEKMFEPFFTTKGHGKGTGLGLAMVREIIRDYNGHIDVESEPGAGTTFRIYLPSLSHGVLQRTPEPPDSEALETLEGTVLLVDDEDVVREIGSDMLKTIGLTCLTAADGTEGLALFQSRMADIGLVILDIEMPGLSGDKVAARLRELDPQVRILIASGYTQDYLEGNVFHAKIEHFIPKPFKIEQLSYQVRKLLKGGHV
jgi:two-component system, cell cycle sensor histidine kinase and response regulator CckA